jgi:four helix bundle protein
MAGATRFENLTAWQRMHELNIEVWKATTRGAAGRDFRFANEIRDAADSAERNVAEGFGRFNPGEFARFLDISRASALETQTLLRKGVSVGYWSEEEFGRLNTLATRGLQAVAKFQRYLRSPRAKQNAARRYTHRRQNDPNANDPNVTNDPNDPNE